MSARAEHTPQVPDDDLYAPNTPARFLLDLAEAMRIKLGTLEVYVSAAAEVYESMLLPRDPDERRLARRVHEFLDHAAVFAVTTVAEYESGLRTFMTMRRRARR